MAEIQKTLQAIEERRAVHLPHIVFQVALQEDLSQIGAEEAAAVPEGRWLYYPISDDAPYGWGDPYEDQQGDPINPPLGTVLARRQCDVLAYTHDGDLHPFRTYDPDTDPQVVHGSEAIGGRFYWKYDDYVITWVPPIGIESYGDANTFGEERGIYRNGSLLAYGPKEGGAGSRPHEIKAAAIKKIGQTTYIYVCVALSTVNNMLQRAVIDPVGSNQTLTWEDSSGMASVFNGLTPAYQSASNFMLSAQFNKSCTRLIINQPGRIFEIGIESWGQEYLIEEKYYFDTYQLLAEDPDNKIFASDIEMPVVSGYAANSDTRRDLVVKIETRSNYNLPPSPYPFEARVDAYVKLDGQIIKQILLTGSYQYERNAIRFLCMQPQLQDIQSGIFIIDTHVLDSEHDPWVEEEGYDEAVCTREFTTEIYRNSTLHSKLEVTEQHPVQPCAGPPTAPTGHDPELFVWANNHPLRDAVYSQFPGGTKNYRFIYPIGVFTGIDKDLIMGMLAMESIGVVLQDPRNNGEHWVLSHRPIQWGVEEPSLQYFNPHNYTAFAADWNGAFQLSAKRFSHWDNGSAVFQWWNTGGTDLVAKTNMTGSNPRFLIRPCSIGQEIKPPNQHIGIIHISEENPFA